MSGLVWPVARSAQDCFLLKHWRAQGAHGESLGAGYLTVWDSQTDEKCHIWAEFTKCLRGGKKKMEPSAVSSLVSASTHSIIRVAPSDCLHSSLYHPAEAVLLQLAFSVGNKQRKTIHLGLFIQKNLWKSEQSMHEWPCAIWIWTTGCAYEALTCELFFL